jgi:hypothetical protein
MARYDENTTTLGQLLDDPEVVAIFDKHAPGVASNPMIGMAKGMTVSAAMGMAGALVPADLIAKIREEVDALQ